MQKRIKFLKIAIVLTTIILVLYFYKSGRDWEIIIGDDWSKNPLLSNASATLEYLKALVKIVITAVIAIVSMQYLNHKD